MVLNVPYEDAKELMAKSLKWTGGKKIFYTRARMLHGILRGAEIEASLKQSRSWDEISGTAIVGVNRKNGYFHWVLVVKNDFCFVIIDPEDGGCYQGRRWIDVKDGYFHSKRKSQYVKIHLEVTSIGCKAIRVLTCA